VRGEPGLIRQGDDRQENFVPLLTIKG
jgi:hypothetical protein